MLHPLSYPPPKVLAGARQHRFHPGAQLWLLPPQRRHAPWAAAQLIMLVCLGVRQQHQVIYRGWLAGILKAVSGRGEAGGQGRHAGQGGGFSVAAADNNGPRAGSPPARTASQHCPLCQPAAPASPYHSPSVSASGAPPTASSPCHQRVGGAPAPSSRATAPSLAPQPPLHQPPRPLRYRTAAPPARTAPGGYPGTAWAAGRAGQGHSRAAKAVPVRWQQPACHALKLLATPAWMASTLPNQSQRQCSTRGQPPQELTATLKWGSGA